jgi:hypothetical protein
MSASRYRDIDEKFILSGIMQGGIVFDDGFSRSG